jgi:hypothetical protein
MLIATQPERTFMSLRRRALLLSPLALAATGCASLDPRSIASSRASSA